MFKLISSIFVCLLGCQPNGAIPQGKPLGTQASQTKPPSDTADSQPLELETPPTPPAGQAPNFQPLDGWKSEPPANAMRAAQYILPKAEGDPEDATLIVYYFGGQGGSVEANFDRWMSQFQQPDGKTSKEASKTSKKTVQNVELHLLEVGGSYIAETAPGSGQRVNKPNFFSRNAVMMSTPGPYFIRLVGPLKTVEKYSADFDTFIDKSLQAPAPK
jgi:hypothetical protein